MITYMIIHFLAHVELSRLPWFGIIRFDVCRYHAANAGHQQGDWRRNLMHDNIEYGFDPHDDSDFINIHDNEVWGNGNHGIIASKRCDRVSIQNNTVYDGGNAGLFLHRSSDDGIVKGRRRYGWQRPDMSRA